MKTLLTLGLLVTVAIPLQAQDSGAFLAIRQAARDSDSERLEQYLDIELKKSPDDPALLEEALLSAFYRLELDEAVDYADRLRELDSNSLGVEISSFTQKLRDDDFRGAYELLENSETLSFVQPEVFEAWALVSEDKTDEAIALLSGFSEEQSEMAFVYDFQRAMIEAYANENYDAAIELIANNGEPIYMSQLTFYSHLALLKLADSPAYEPFLTENFGERDAWPSFVERLVSQLDDGDIPQSLDFASPQNAIGDYLLALVSASRPDQFDSATQQLLYGLVPNITPENAWFLNEYMNQFYDRGLFFRDRFGDEKRAENEFEDALRAFSKIDKDSFVYPSALQTRINALFALDRVEEAREWADKAKPKAADEIAFRGEVYRRLEDYANATTVYEQSIALTGRENERAIWPIYGLAISYERLGDWENAEPNFLNALELDPENPDILNYLGYSYVDRGEKLDTGLEMIEKAVEIAPAEAHIIDSLGWAYFRLERYDEALEPLENATSLLPDDPILNSHLGDLYWKLGREREARYQWERSLMFLEEDNQDLTRAELENRLQNGV